MSMNVRSTMLSGVVACLLMGPMVAGAQGSAAPANKDASAKPATSGAADSGAKMAGPDLGSGASSSETVEGRLQVSGAQRKEPLKCGTGQEVEIAGSMHNFQISGDCGEIVIQGTSNKVKIEAAKSITVSGVGNKVTYKRGVGSDEPEKKTLGTNNTLTKEK